VTPGERAAELMVEARDLLVRGEIAEARVRLDQVAALWREEGNEEEEARSLRLAASLARHEGNLDDAEIRASVAVKLAPEGQAQAKALAERARVAAAEGDRVGAAGYWEQAVAAAEGEDAEDLPTLLRGLGAALADAGRPDDAAAAFRRAASLLDEAGDALGGARALLEGATALQTAGHSSLAAELGGESERGATALDDHETLAQLALLESARALDVRNPEQALASAERARAESLAARSPITYVGAAIAIAQLEDASGRRFEAYESLAKGWVTLGDLLGREQARAFFEPALLDLRQRWGDDAFAEVKLAYEERRREAMR
jgi:tetratricopeptide (TPR) repeat protein